MKLSVYSLMDVISGLSDTEEKYMKTLNAPDYASFREHKVEKAADGTFQWFWLRKDFRSWLSNDESSLLWIRGSPGQGKTVLSKFLLEGLESLSRDSQHKIKVIYFFCYDQDERFRTVNSVLRSLIKQMLTTADLSQHISEIFIVDFFMESEDSLWEALQAIIRATSFNAIYCVLDVLDECEDKTSRKRLLQRITRLLQTPTQRGKNFPVLKWIVTSRPMVDISRELSRFETIDLKASPDDLKVVINRRVSDLDF